MKYLKYVSLFSCLIASFLLSGCSVIGRMQNDYLYTTLPDGSKLHYNTNMPPTAAWGCKSVGRPLSYNFAKIKDKSIFNMSGYTGYLTNQAKAYLAAHKLKANYMNMSIPEQKSLGVGGFDFNLRRHSRVTLYLYQCKKINPNDKAGHRKTESWSIG